LNAWDVLTLASTAGHSQRRSRPISPNRDQFASYNGTAPIEVSSADRVIYRLSRRGNQQLNHAIHVVAVSQISHHGSLGKRRMSRT
jgi:transposase